MRTTTKRDARLIYSKFAENDVQFSGGKHWLVGVHESFMSGDRCSIVVERDELRIVGTALVEYRFEWFRPPTLVCVIEKPILLQHTLLNVDVDNSLFNISSGIEQFGTATTFRDGPELWLLWNEQFIGYRSLLRLPVVHAACVELDYLVREAFGSTDIHQ